MEEIPDWMISNYFYREMSPVLRYAALPFLLLFNVSLLFLALGVLDAAGIWSLPIRLATAFLGRFGIVGVLIDAVIVINVFVIVLVSIVSVPVFFLVRDVRKTLARFGFVTLHEPGAAKDAYLEGAQAVFEAHPDVAVFVYGHTHRASLTEVDGRLVVNTGTWLKRLHRQSVVFGLLPWVFYPSFRLNYFRITEEDGAVVVDYRVVEKPNPTDLTILERLLSRKPATEDPIPGRTVIDPGREPDRVDRARGPQESSSPSERTGR